MAHSAELVFKLQLPAPAPVLAWSLLQPSAAHMSLSCQERAWAREAVTVLACYSCDSITERLPTARFGEVGPARAQYLPPLHPPAGSSHSRRLPHFKLS